MSISAFAGGASDALQEILKQKFLEIVQRQRQEVAMRGLDQEAQRDAANRELGFGRLGLDRENLGLNTRRVSLDESKFGEDKSRYAAEAGDRAADTAYKGALTGEIIRKPTAEQQDREFTTSRDKTLHGYRLNAIGAEAAAQRPREERIVQVEGPDGRPTWVRESEAVGKPAAQAARAVTGSERGVLAYYNRAKDAEDTISSADQSGKSLEDRVAKAGLATQAGLQYLPNVMQSSDMQAYRQAQRAFTEARLRKESGAAIPTAEYENDAKTYFAQPGDKPETIKQKRLKRQTVLDGLKFSSGRAYDEFYGEPSQKPKGGGSIIKSITEIK